MTVAALVRRIHAAIGRPFRHPPIDRREREAVERRQREIAARLAGYRQAQWATALRRHRESAE